jgi:Chaperone of endosialidase
MRKSALYALAGACAGVLITTTSALAGSGVGGVFNLGQQNTVDATSVLSGTVAAPLLRVVNANGDFAGIKAESAGGAGSALYGLHNSSDGTGAGVLGYSLSAAGPGMLGVNTAGGPGLSVTVDQGVPPLKVNSSGLVTNLNADKLDSIDSTFLWKLGGNAIGNFRVPVFLGTTDNNSLVLKANGLPALRLEPVGIESPNLIGGFTQNDVGDVAGATIAGGGNIDDRNFVSGGFGSVGGGAGNRAGLAATVAGGFHNVASGPNSTIAGGGLEFCNLCIGDPGNTASGGFSAIAGGKHNTASGYGSAVAGGRDNTASNGYTFAAGYRAVADDNGSFVWSDGNWLGGDTFVYSPVARSFSAHATGGFNFWTNKNGPTTGCSIAAGGGSINCSSSRRVKKDFASVDRATLLRRLNGIPVSTWSYKQEKAGVRHIGPMAHDFHRAFRVGEDDTSIAMVDADGVALAAIQGLYRQNRALQRENWTLRDQLGAQNARLTRLERAVSALSR